MNHDAPKKSGLADEIRRTLRESWVQPWQRWRGSSGYIRLSRLL